LVLTSTHYVLNFGLLQDGYILPEDVVGEDAELEAVRRVDAPWWSSLQPLPICSRWTYSPMPLKVKPPLLQAPVLPKDSGVKPC
jgi:hypothetical protein